MIEVENDEMLKPVINRYLRKIYALAFYLIGGDSDKAYQITASSYVETFMSLRSLDNENEIIVKLVQEAIKQRQANEGRGQPRIKTCVSQPEGL